MRTACLLELSNGVRPGVGLEGFAVMVAEALARGLALDGCRVQLRAHGLAPVEASCGALAGHQHRVAFAGATGDDGVLTVICGAASRCEAGFLAVAAEQVGRAFETLAENERLRRNAAAATALRLATSVDDLALEETLEALVDALAELPNAIGATLDIDQPSVGPPLRLTSGTASDHTTEHRVGLTIGEVVVHMAWAAEAEVSELIILDDVLTALFVSMTRAEQFRQLRHDAEVDPLTGVGNRRRASRMLAHALSRGDRYGEQVAVVMLGLDGFTEINDRLGCAAGDGLLRATAESLVQHVRGYDTVARLDVQTFAVICPAMDAAGAYALAERLGAGAVACAARSLGEETVVSIGVAVYPTAAEPTAAEPTAAEPTAAEPTAAEPTADRVMAAAVAAMKPVNGPAAWGSVRD